MPLAMTRQIGTSGMGVDHTGRSAATEHQTTTSSSG
jgi:hypothetical protein